jgi:hypothetical protein
MTSSLDTAYRATLDAWDFLPWWSPWVSAFVTILGVLLRFRWVLALIPAAGPILLMVANWIVSVIGLIVTAVLVPYLKLLGEGIGRALTSRAGWAVTITGAMVFIIGGIVIGVRLDAHLVKAANKQLKTVIEERDEALADNTKWKGRLDEQADRAAKAIKDRTEAEEAAAKRIAEVEAGKAKADVEARTARGALYRLKRLYDDAGKGGATPGSKNAPGSGLPSLSSLFSGSGK